MAMLFLSQFCWLILSSGCTFAPEFHLHLPNKGAPDMIIEYPETEESDNEDSR